MLAGRAAALVLAVLLASGADVAGQGGPPMTEARVRALARQARNESRGDATDLVLALDRRVREAWGEFESFPPSIVKREDLLVTLSTPYMAYRRSVVDLLRTGRRVEDATWVDAAVIAVGPARLGAPDVVAVALTRDGRDVPPIKNLLRPMTFTNGAGGQEVLNAGDVHFQMSAFAPGSVVVLTLRPRNGEPFVHRFSDAELATLK